MIFRGFLLRVVNGFVNAALFWALNGPAEATFCVGVVTQVASCYKTASLRQLMPRTVRGPCTRPL